MKIKNLEYALLILLVLCGHYSLAQSRQDSITYHYDSLAKARLQNMDSSGQQLNKKIDAAQQEINNLLNPNLNQLANRSKPDLNKAKHDSIRFYKQLDKEKKRVLRNKEEAERKGLSVAEYIKQLDSLNHVIYKPDSANSIAMTKQKLLANKQNLTQSTDSLAKVNLSTRRYSNKLDPLTQKPLNQISEGESKITQAEQKLNEPVNKLESKINEKLNLMNQEGGVGANLPGSVNSTNAQLNTDMGLTDKVKLPSTELRTNNPLNEVDNPLKEQMGGAGEVKDKLNDVKNIPQDQIGKVKSIEEVKSVTDKIGSANQLTDKAQAYGDDVNNIAKGDLNAVKELPKAAEQQAMKIDELQGIQKETGQFDQYKQIADKAKDPEALKEEAMKQATTKAIDHFTGQQEVLKTAMDKVSKLKSKYSSLSSMTDIPKRKPNVMKGKPFMERIVPGLTLQIQKSQDVILDYNPNIGYRFYGRFTAGAGWNERITIDKQINISLKDRIYGPRVFADFKVGKGFSVRTDIEKMNTYVPSLTSSGYSTSEEYRAWVWSAFIGIKKEYQFIKKVKGTFQIMYNLYDDHNNSPYADKLNTRFGFDFPLTKKNRPKAQTAEVGEN